MAEAEQPEFSNLVVVGASAGGIDALSVVLGSLPADFGAPIVVAQHLDPSRISHLEEILARRSPLRVRTVTRREALVPGTVYVIPSNRNVLISDSHVEIDADGSSRPKPSVDLLLRTASDAFGERLIALILSGTGSDGAAGAWLVKRGGGTVIIQDPDTATYPGMPLALAPSTVDIVATLDRMGPILQDLLAGMAVPTRPDEKKALETFLAEVRERTGIDFNGYKTPTILRRLQRRIVATDTDDIEAYRQYLHRHPEEYQALVGSFLIKVTEFFRDPELYTFLREGVVPNLVNYARSRGRQVRIWSAGCATGEEAYSLAILIAEALGDELDQWNVRIFATDVDAEAVAFARRGIYPDTALLGVPEEIITRYFTRDDDTYQIKKRVRSLTVFGQHDLGQRAPFPHIDMVVCRNVLIYFTPDLQARTLQLFAYSLRDDGYLVLGKAESTGALSEFFVAQHKQQKVYRRHGDRILMPPSRFTNPLPAPPQRLSLPKRSVGALEAAAQQEAQRARRSPEHDLSRLPVGVVVVNRRYDILTINTAARRFLSIHGTAIGEDLVHIAQDVPPQRLRSAIDIAFKQGMPSGVDEFAVREVTTNEPRYLQITCHPLRADGEQGPVESVMVVVSDITSLVTARRQAEERMEVAAAELESARDTAQREAIERDELVQRLVETNRALIEANQELTSANEEMRTTNEELLLSTEEAQAATEEVETLNEELQATNEELETLNEELQSTIEELNTTNDDLHARSAELHDLARSSEDERARLAAILAGLADAVLVVTTSGAPLLTNAAYERAFGPNGERLVPLDDTGHPLPTAQIPRLRASRGETFTMEFTTLAEDGARRWFEASGRPVSDGDGLHQWGVVVIREITERSLHRLQDEFLALASHELRTPLTSLRVSLDLLNRALPEDGGDARVRRYTTTAREQTRRLGRLIEDLLDVTRLQTGKYTLSPERIALEDLVTGTVEVAQTLTEAQRIQVSIANAPLVISGDPGRLEQVLLNLLSNAIKYAPEAKRIDVRLRRVDDEAELEVQDYGPGIPQEDVPHLFSRYYQATHRTGEGRTSGLGLGLYIAQQLVAAHGGRITVASKLKKGTSFIIRLPLAQ